MKRLTIADAESVILALQDEIRRSPEARYDHRLHGLLLVAQGMSAREVGNLLGDGPRTVAYWVNRFERDGLEGLIDAERAGRPPRLTTRQVAAVASALRRTPAQHGLEAELWDGKLLSAYIEQRWDVQLGVRQCQRLFRRLGFRLRKPRGKVAQADPDAQRRVKKTPPSGARPRGGSVGTR